MSVEDRIRQSSETFCKRLQGDLASQIEEFAAELARAAEEERAAAVADATAPLATELAAWKSDAAQMHEELAERAREEAREASEAEIAGLRAEIERLTADRQQAVQSDVVAALSGERQTQMQSVERVLGVVRSLDAAESLTEILTALAEGAAAEAPRVALLTVQGGRVRSWRLLGFGPDAPPVDLNEQDAGVVTRAIEQHDIAFAEPAAPGHAVPPGPGFTALPPDRSGLAVPIFVGGAPVAVLYADDVADIAQEKPSAWPEAVEILTRHAALRLENITAVRTAQALKAGPQPAADAPASPPPFDEDLEASARRYARLLVSEIKFYNEAAVRVGRQKADLLERLHTEIARARKQFDERIPAGVPSASAIFDDELVQTLADGDVSLLGPLGDALS